MYEYYMKAEWIEASAMYGYYMKADDKIGFMKARSEIRVLKYRLRISGTTRLCKWENNVKECFSADIVESSDCYQ